MLTTEADSSAPNAIGNYDGFVRSSCRHREVKRHIGWDIDSVRTAELWQGSEFPNINPADVHATANYHDQISVFRFHQF